MKKENCGNKDNELYESLDSGLGYKESEYYGIFGYDLSDYSERVSYETIDIDPKRYQKILGKLSPEQLEVINGRKTHYFRPAKRHRRDYNCNIFSDEIESIKSDWSNIFKGVIQREQARVKEPKELVAADDENFMCGITDYEESSTWAVMTNLRNRIKYDNEVFKIVNSLYAQFFHQMASCIEAVTIFVLAKNGKNVEHFERNALYDYAGEKDKLYCIWNFIKHNSLSTYEKLKSKYSDVLVDSEFKQGYLACYFVKFSEDLILEILEGCGEFFKEYCACVYHEDFNEAQWNYDDYFIQPMLDYYDEIENID